MADNPVFWLCLLGSWLIGFITGWLWRWHHQWRIFYHPLLFWDSSEEDIYDSKDGKPVGDNDAAPQDNRKD
jgi:hypothetical protein